MKTLFHLKRALCDQRDADDVGEKSNARKTTENDYSKQHWKEIYFNSPDQSFGRFFAVYSETLSSLRSEKCNSEAVESNGA